MHKGVQAYGAVARQIADPRSLEADLLLKAAARLQAVKDGWDSTKPNLYEALQYNRKLWTILVAGVTNPDHHLPPEIRQNVANLGIFVLNRTVALTADPQPERINPLITINRELAAGLRGAGA